MLNLINEQEDIDKIYLYAKNLSEPKYEYLIKNREIAGIKHVNDSKAFIESSNTMIFVKILITIIWAKKENINYFWWYDCRNYDKQKIPIINQRIIY